MKTLTTVSGRTKQIPDFPQKQEYPDQVTESDVVGLDLDGRIVVDLFHVRGKEYNPNNYLFGLTLCCNASDKGTEHGTVCRRCYGHEHGKYIWIDSQGEFPGVDAVESII